MYHISAGGGKSLYIHLALHVARQPLLVNGLCVSDELAQEMWGQQDSLARPYVDVQAALLPQVTLGVAKE